MHPFYTKSQHIGAGGKMLKSQRDEVLSKHSEFA